MTGKIPGPYVHDCKEDDGLMEYAVPGFATMEIGARKSGLPSAASTGPKNLDHVGGSQGKSGKHNPDNG